jgi:serine/threonine protein kinase
MVQEYCSGGELIDLLKGHSKVPELVTLYFVKQVLSAIEHLNSSGVAH